MTVRCLLTGHHWYLSGLGCRDCGRCRAWQWRDDRGRWRHCRAGYATQRVCSLPGGRMLLVSRDRPRLRIRRGRR